MKHMQPFQMIDLCNNWPGRIKVFAPTWYTSASASSSAALRCASQAAFAALPALVVTAVYPLSPWCITSSLHRPLVAALIPCSGLLHPDPLSHRFSPSLLFAVFAVLSFTVKPLPGPVRVLSALAPCLPLCMMKYNAQKQEKKNYICSVFWRRFFLYPGYAFTFSLTIVY